MRLSGRDSASGAAIELVLSGEQIAEVRPLEVAPERQVELPWLAPGWFDLQVNGYGGQEFSAATLDEAKVAEIVAAMAPFGVTRLCPTVTTQSLAVLTHALRTIAAACRGSAALARQIPGIHLEGPYLSRQDGPRGAHPLAHIREPDWDEFQRLQEAAEGRIRLLTVSAEYGNAPAFIRRVVDTGVVVALGHTAATAEQLRAAVDAGARVSTHLGNGSHAMLPRLRNYLWEQLAEDRLMAGLIVDGHHLPPAVVQTFVRAKTPARVILVSDLSGQAGQPPGRYRSDFCEVEILPDGKLVIAGQRELLAGATVPLDRCLANVMRFAGVDLASAVRMVVDHPAQLLDIPADALRAGAPANLVQFQLSPDAIVVEKTIVAGTVVHSREEP